MPQRRASSPIDMPLSRVTAKTVRPVYAAAGTGKWSRSGNRAEGAMAGAQTKRDVTCDDDRYRRPDGVDDETVAAVGAVTEAIEWLERARGHLYDFHQLVGHADELLGDAAEQLRAAQRGEQADTVEREAVGRNV